MMQKKTKYSEKHHVLNAFGGSRAGSEDEQVNLIVKYKNTEGAATAASYNIKGAALDIKKLSLEAVTVRQGDPVKICVVDTGYGLGHPDLPTNTHGVSGTDTSS